MSMTRWMEGTNDFVRTRTVERRRTAEGYEIEEIRVLEGKYLVSVVKSPVEEVNVEIKV